MEKRIPVEDLAIGMFVAELDRPWLDTPFLLQGFLIDSPEQIAELQRFCRHVYIDPLRSTEAARPLDLDRFSMGREHSNPLPLSWPFDNPNVQAPNWNLVEYLDQVSMEAELPQAKEIFAEGELVISELFDSVREAGLTDLTRANEIVDAMVESVVRNPDALTLLARIRRKSHYVYAHALNVSIHMLAFGRHLGFPKEDLQPMGLGGLLLDVGTLRVPNELLSRRGKLAEEEYRTVQRHVEYGIDLLHHAWGLSGVEVDIVRGHHEREDGSGYPEHLIGPQIGAPAKMAAIVDCFDALTSVRPYARTHTPYEALQMLYEWGKHTLHGPLVEQFINCLGIYPVGGLVELNSGEVGLVIAHNRVRRLKPRILLLLDPSKKPYRSPITLDLLTAPKLPDDVPYAIARALEDGMYGLNPQDYYL
jgi:HD-GYP domain-containing protein (c-di-GMP phosphodiesterase class II)